MLRLYDSEKFDRSKHSNVILDVEEAFWRVKLQNDETTRKLLKGIDGAEFLDKDKVIDRFGVCIYTSELSTGCKAALCTNYLSDKIIDLRECGYNARDNIIYHCTHGSIIFYYEDMTINSYGKENMPIVVSIDDKTFDRIDDLNEYLGY